MATGSLKLGIFGKAIIALVSTGAIGAGVFGGEVATMQKEASGIFWMPVKSVEAVMLKVAGPNGFYVEKVCDASDVSITSFGADGLYRYELTSMKSPDHALRSMSREEREAMPMTRSQKAGLGLKESGHFRIADGKPVLNDDAQEK